MNISLVLICMEIILLIASNKKSINYSNIFNSPNQPLSVLSVPSLLAILFYYLLQVLFNLLLIESIRIYCNYLLNRRTLKSRGYIYYTGTDQQIDSNLLKYIRWSRSKCLTYGLAYLLPLLSCCLILLFVEDGLKFFISSLLLIEPPVSSLTTPSNQVPPPIVNQIMPEDNYPQLGLLILCFAFTYLVLFMAILLIFIAAKGCWRLQRNFTLGKLNDSHKFGSSTTYSNTLSTANYNQLTLNSLKQNGTSGPQIPQINTLSAMNNNIDNSLCSAQLDPGYLLTNYTKRATMKLLIIVLIGQTFGWSIWLALCHLNSRLNAHLDDHQFNDADQQEQHALSAILQVLVVIFACLNIAQSIFVLASAFHKNHKINSSSIDATDRNLFGSKMQFGLKCLPICVRKTGASPLPLIGGNNQLSSSALNSAASSIQQSQLMIQPNIGSTGQQPVYFYSLDPNQLNSQSNQLNNQPVQPSSPIIKLNNTNFHTMMLNRNTNNYLTRDVNTMCRQAAKHNDYLLANTTTTNNRILNGSKSQHNLVPYLIQQQQQSRPQSYASSNQRFQDVNPYAPPVLIDDHRLNEHLINENLLTNQLSNDQGDYEEVLPANFDYLNSTIVQPGQQQQQTNILLNAANSAAIMNRHSQAAAVRLSTNLNGNKNSTSSRTNSTNSDNPNSFNNLQQYIPNYNTNGHSTLLHQNGQQFESEQDIYESVESPCIYTR